MNSIERSVIGKNFFLKVIFFKDFLRLLMFFLHPTIYTGWSTQRVHRYIFQNMHCTKKCYIQKLHSLKGYTLLCINFFYRWRRFEDLKVNFVFLNRILYFLYQNMVEYRIVSKKVLTFISPKHNS